MMKYSAMFGLIVAAAVAPPALAKQTMCEEYEVPVSVTGVPNAVVWGELCWPKEGPFPTTVQFLVHGSTHNHNMWDFPFQPHRYSHVRAATDAGYATFNIDRFGTGRSTTPASHLVDLPATLDALYQVATRLRAGDLCDAPCSSPPFAKVLYFGSSLSTAYGWQLGHDHPDLFDGFVLAGLGHFTTPYWLDLVLVQGLAVFPANQDPVFADKGLDDGYITTTPGDDIRALQFIRVEASQEVVPKMDEPLKGELTRVLIEQSAFTYVVGPPVVPPEAGPLPCDTTIGPPSPSCGIDKPVFLLIGEFDGPTCGPAPEDPPWLGPPGPIPTCTDASVHAHEQPYYTQPLAVKVIPRAKHSIHLHDTYRPLHDGWLVPGLVAAGLAPY